MESYIVYAKVSEAGYVTAVNSSAFLKDTSGWIQIDEGFGDRYHHAQNHYLDGNVATEAGAYRYRMENGQITECSAEDIRAQEAALAPEQGETADAGNVWDELDAAYQEGVDSV